jgi:predicted membrane protein (TIGR00267 family)
MLNPHENKDFIHHNLKIHSATIKEGIFGIEDGLVSTFGAVTGIAAATQDPHMIILSGCIVVSVESISMGIGSFLSTKSEIEFKKRIIEEEKIELKNYEEYENNEIVDLFKKDGWSEELAIKMAEETKDKKDLMLKEMMYRELNLPQTNGNHSIKNAFVMFTAYIIGGMVPLLSYFFFPIKTAITGSIILTLLALFCVGAGVSKFSFRKWWKSGMEMLFLASAAGGIGYLVGQLANYLSK